MVDVQRLTDLSSPALIRLVREVQQKKRFLVGLVTVGSVEQHGPLLPLGTDSFFAEGSAEALAKRWTGGFPWRALLVPTVHYTNTDSCIDFAGTVSVPNDSSRTYLRAVVEGLRKLDFAALVLISGHAPNDPILKEIAYAANNRSLHSKEINQPPVLVTSLAEAMDRVYTETGLPRGKHGDWLEACLLNHLMGGALLDASSKSFSDHARACGEVDISLLGIPLIQRGTQGVLGVGWPQGEDVEELTAKAWDLFFSGLTSRVESHLAEAVELFWPNSWSTINS